MMALLTIVLISDHQKVNVRRMGKLQLTTVIQGGLSYQDWLAARCTTSSGNDGPALAAAQLVQLNKIVFQISACPLVQSYVARGYMHCLLCPTISKCTLITLDN